MIRSCTELSCCWACCCCCWLLASSIFFFWTDGKRAASWSGGSRGSLRRKRSEACESVSLSVSGESQTSSSRSARPSPPPRGVPAGVPIGVVIGVPPTTKVFAAGPALKPSVSISGDAVGLYGRPSINRNRLLNNSTVSKRHFCNGPQTRHKHFFLIYVKKKNMAKGRGAYLCSKSADRSMEPLVPYMSPWPVLLGSGTVCNKREGRRKVRRFTRRESKSVSYSREDGSTVYNKRPLFTTDGATSESALSSPSSVQSRVITSRKLNSSARETLYVSLRASL